MFKVKLLIHLKLKDKSFVAHVRVLFHLVPRTSKVGREILGIRLGRHHVQLRLRNLYCISWLGTRCLGLGVLVLGKGAKDFDLLPLSSTLNRLGLSLQQM